MILLFLGPPGAGKGTQAKKVAQEFHYKHISTGDILRTVLQDENNPVGQKIQKFIEAGELVPDSIIIELVETALDDVQTYGGAVLDGVPRNFAQAQVIEDYIEAHFKKPIAVNFQVDDDVIVQRLSSRRVCQHCQRIFNVDMNPELVDEPFCPNCGGQVVVRPDDQPETIRRRLEVYRELTVPVIQFYKDKEILLEIDGDDAPEKIFKKILKGLQKYQ